MLASAQTLRRLQPILPFREKTIAYGLSYGLSACGYDIRIAESLRLLPGTFTLGSSEERFVMLHNLCGVVHDKSTWARLGLAVQNTVIEPGWEGFLTLELTNHSKVPIDIVKGMPIAQVLFHILDEPTILPYTGKYQDQEAGAQSARFEQDTQR